MVLDYMPHTVTRPPPTHPSTTPHYTTPAHRPPSPPQPRPLSPLTRPSLHLGAVFGVSRYWCVGWAVGVVGGGGCGGWSQPGSQKIVLGQPWPTKDNLGSIRDRHGQFCGQSTQVHFYFQELPKWRGANRNRGVGRYWWWGKGKGRRRGWGGRGMEKGRGQGGGDGLARGGALN
jgi:hypothetical protein